MMVKSFLLFALICLSVSAQADFSSTVTLSSNYIWRGQSFSTGGVSTEASSGGPVIQGAIDYVHASGVGLGLFTGNSDSTTFGATPVVVRDTETDINLNYKFQFSDEMSIGGYAFWYNYLKNPSNNSMEYLVYLAYGDFRVDGSYMPTFFGIDSSSTYFKLSYRKKVEEKFGVLAHVGRSIFGDKDLLGYKDYLDYRAGFFFEVKPLTVDIAYTDTDRADLSGNRFKDQAVAITANMSF